MAEDPLTARLRATPTTDDIRAQAWDAYQSATDANDLAAKIKNLKMPDSVKADLWDMKAKEAKPQASLPADAGVPSKATTLATIGAAVPALATAASEIATNPNAAKLGASAGRVIGGVGSVIGGAMEGGPIGALAGVGAASKAAWAGGKTGWFAGRMLQDVSAPVATALETLKPYAQAISTVSGAQGVLDLAQMAEPTRKDIGTLGFSFEGRPQSDKDAHPALINAVANKIGDYASELAKNGVPAAEAMAVKILSDGNAAVFGRLMNLYAKAKATVQ